MNKQKRQYQRFTPYVTNNQTKPNQKHKKTSVTLELFRKLAPGELWCQFCCHYNIGGCCFDNSRFYQWRQSWHYENFLGYVEYV